MVTSREVTLVVQSGKVNSREPMTQKNIIQAKDRWMNFWRTIGAHDAWHFRVTPPIVARAAAVWGRAHTFRWYLWTRVMPRAALRTPWNKTANHFEPQMAHPCRFSSKRLIWYFLHLLTFCLVVASFDVACQPVYYDADWITGTKQLPCRICKYNMIVVVLGDLCSMWRSPSKPAR